MGSNVGNGMLCMVLLTSTLLALPVAAREGGPRFDSYLILADNAGGVDLDSTVRQLRSETGGRVLQAETRRRDGRSEHHVRIITKQGKVKRYRIDADSGKKVPRSRWDR